MHGPSAPPTWGSATSGSRCDVSAEALGLSASLTVLVPQATTGRIGMPGAAPLGLAVVMPQVHRSSSTDEAVGGRYWTFLSQELPDLVASMLRVSTRREDTFVAGLSTGGYGAVKWALRQPERFAAAASLSGVLDVASRGRGWSRPEDPHLGRRVFGEEDLAGSQDELITDHRAFVGACERAGVAVSTDVGPGAHDWAYWDDQVEKVLAWLPPGR